MILNVFAADVAAERRRDWMATADAHRLSAQARRSRPGNVHWWQLRVRAVRPDDGPAFVEVFDGLGLESRIARYLAPKARLTGSDLRTLTTVDHASREGFVVLTRWGGHAVATAELIRNTDDPTSAEVAAAVVDAWQGRGVGTLLARRLVVRAGELGIVAFTAMTAHGNIRAQLLLAQLGEVRITGRDGATVNYRVTLRGAAAAAGAGRSARLGATRRAIRGAFGHAQLGPVTNYVAR